MVNIFGKAAGLFFFRIALCGSGSSKETSLTDLNAGLDPLQPQIQRFVAYLKENGLGVSYATSERRWQAVRETDVIQVSLRTLPSSATEEEM